MSFIQTIKSYNPTFWVANFLQIIERGAWFGVFSLLGLYLVASTDEGGLGLSHIQKGNILANVTAIQFFLPLFFGVIADRIGYKHYGFWSLLSDGQHRGLLRPCFFLLLAYHYGLAYHFPTGGCDDLSQSLSSALFL